MARKHLSRKARTVPKTVLRLPDLDQAKSAVLNSLSSQDAQRGYRHVWRSSLSGPARSRDCRSARRLSCGVACAWNPGSLHPEQWTCGSGPCGGSRRKPPIAVSLARNLPPVFGE